MLNIFCPVTSSSPSHPSLLPVTSSPCFHVLSYRQSCLSSLPKSNHTSKWQLFASIKKKKRKKIMNRLCSKLFGALMQQCSEFRCVLPLWEMQYSFGCNVCQQFPFCCNLFQVQSCSCHLKISENVHVLWSIQISVLNNWSRITSTPAQTTAILFLLIFNSEVFSKVSEHTSDLNS